jgi:hypothetical protein
MEGHIIAAHSDEVKRLVKRGAEAIEELKSFIDEEFKEELPITHATNGSLSVSYFGLPLLFRIEIDSKCKAGNLATPASAKLVAYKLSYEIEPDEIRLAECTFDTVGNVSFPANPRASTVDEFAGAFLNDVFISALDKGIQLRP